MNNNNVKQTENQTANNDKRTFNGSVKSPFNVKKIILLCLVFIISYVVSLFLNGFHKTNLNLLYF